jgi:hypothetical protein
MDEIITQRLVEMTFAPLDEVAVWLTRLGMEVRQREEGVVTVRNPYLDITTALMNISDPITRAVCLGFALAGVSWPQAFPNLLKAVDKAWRLRQKQTASSDQAPPSAGSSPGPTDHKSQRAQKLPPATTPTFADLYKNRNSGA